MITRQELSHVLNSIGLIDCPDQLERVRAEISRAWARLDVAKSRKFHIGQDVVFKTRRGMVEQGKIVKFLPKNIRVKISEGGTWTVAPSLLTPA
jgi:hypothetical protein